MMQLFKGPYKFQGSSWSFDVDYLIVHVFMHIFCKLFQAYCFIVLTMNPAFGKAVCAIV